MTSDPNRFHLPFEDQPETPLEGDFAVSGGIVVMAVLVPLPDETKRPAIVFRFARADGSGFWPPVLLLLDDDQLRQVPGIVFEAVRRARSA